jgi:hypothetical protein
MRVVLTAAMLIAIAGLLAPQGVSTRAQAQECTGENCPPPSGQGRGGRGCQHGEDTVS